MLIGLSIAAPVGPIGLLVIRRSLAEGRRVGLASGMGAASADAVYGIIAAFGLSAISGLLISFAPLLRLFGGLFLLYIGMQTLTTRPSSDAARVRRGSGLAGAYLSTFFLTFSNPMTILAFVSIFAGLGLAERTQEAGAAVVMVLGIFAGSALWWLLLSGAVSLLRHRMGPVVLLWVNRLSGVVILGFALLILLNRL